MKRLTLALLPILMSAMVYSACRKNVVATYLAGQRVEFDARGLVDQARQIAARLQSLRS